MIIKKAEKINKLKLVLVIANSSQKYVKQAQKVIENSQRPPGKNSENHEIDSLKYANYSKMKIFY